jgi:phospholipid-binding lipoprotein MlaA
VSAKKLRLPFILFILFLLPACAHRNPVQSGLDEPIKTESPSGASESSVAEHPFGETVPEFEEAKDETIADPLEPWNRAMFTFNDRLYYWVMKPASKGYNAVVPEGARQSVRNFFNNLTMPVRFVSSLLQAKIEAAGIELARFCINSTMGVAGLFDVAKSTFKLEPQERDIGQTLGKYGIGEGFYIIWPFLGPSSVRDTAGTVGEVFLSPVSYVKPPEDAVALDGYDYFNRTSLRIGEYEDLKESAIEPYIALRNAYIQHRRSRIEK